MKLIDIIKAENLTARKNKDKFVGGILTTLIGEMEMVGKTSEEDYMHYVIKEKNEI